MPCTVGDPKENVQGYIKSNFFPLEYRLFEDTAVITAKTSRWLRTKCKEIISGLGIQE